jgi:hypothetical protein
MRPLSIRERLFALVAVVALVVALMDAAGSLNAKHRELEDIRRQIDVLRAGSTALYEVQSTPGIASVKLTKDALLEMVAQAGRRLDSIQIAQTEHGISAVFAGEPAVIWAFYAVISTRRDVMVDELSLKSSGSRLRGTLRLVVSP